MAIITKEQLLLVEDNTDYALRIRESLEEYGYGIITAVSTDEAASKVKNIDLILIDISRNDTGLDGIEAAVKITEESDVPIIFLFDPDKPEMLEKTESIISFGYIARDSAPAVLDASVKSALKLFRFNHTPDKCNNESTETGLMLDDVLNTIPVRVFWKDLDSVYMGCNRLFAEDSGKNSPEEIVGLTDFDIRTFERAELNRIDDRLIINKGESRINYEEPFITKEGETNWISTSKIPLRDSCGKMYGILGMYENITERKLMQEELLLQKTRLANILDGSNVGTWEWNVQTGENIVDEHWASIIGCSKEEIAVNCSHFWKHLVHPDDLHIAEEALEKHFRRELDYFECEFRMRHKSGDWVWILSRGKVITRNEDDEPVLVSGTHLDITERKKAQDEILHQLSEKEIILKEVHHRIKNNFSSICSLLGLQAATVESPEAENALQDAIGRVHSMQVLYEKLLLAEDYRNSSLKQYLSDLIDDIVNIFPERANIKIEKNICECRLEQKQLFSLGIVVNELITNVMKYAFEGREAGTLRIALEDDGDYYNLVIKDDGVGLPEDFDIDSRKGFGLMLIKILCKQLPADFTIENDNGTKTTLRIRI